MLSIDLAIDYGYNGCSGFLPENCDQALPAKIIALDRKTMTAEFLPGIVIPLRPFFGSMGVAPAADAGRVSSNPPGRHAGNLDNRELVAGSTLYIPVFVPGALFEVGDGHAAQGDGEVDQTAIETSLRGRLQLDGTQGHEAHVAARGNADRLHQHGDRPGSDDCDRGAIQEMVDFLVAEKHLTQHQAYQLVSIAGNVAVTQLVDKPNHRRTRAAAEEHLQEMSRSCYGALPLSPGGSCARCDPRGPSDRSRPGADCHRRSAAPGRRSVSIPGVRSRRRC